MERYSDELHSTEGVPLMSCRRIVKVTVVPSPGWEERVTAPPSVPIASLARGSPRPFPMSVGEIRLKHLRKDILRNAQTVV